MSELNNREQRQETLKGIIKDLHGGVSTDEIKVRFGELLDQVGPTEIADIEQSLINEGLAVEEIQKLCDIHVAVFKESLEKQKVAEIEQVQEDQRSLARITKGKPEVHQSGPGHSKACEKNRCDRVWSGFRYLFGRLEIQAPKAFRG